MSNWACGVALTLEGSLAFWFIFFSLWVWVLCSNQASFSVLALHWSSTLHSKRGGGYLRTIMQASLPLRASFPSAGRSFLTRREGQALNCPQGWDGGFLFTSTGCCTKVMIIITLILINNIRGEDTGAGYDNIGNCQYHLVGIARCLE